MSSIYVFLLITAVIYIGYIIVALLLNRRDKREQDVLFDKLRDLTDQQFRRRN